jgi:hypothetical protein
MVDRQIQAVIDVYSCATAFGGMKMQDFQKFLKSLVLEKTNVDAEFEKVKASGLPIEEK